jgi:hypothetical protein
VATVAAGLDGVVEDAHGDAAHRHHDQHHHHADACAQPAHRVVAGQHVEMKACRHQRQRAEPAEESVLAAQRVAQQAWRQQHRQRQGEGDVAQRGRPRSEHAGQPEAQPRRQPEGDEAEADAPAERRAGGEFGHRGEDEAGHRGEAETQQQLVLMPDQRAARDRRQRQAETEKAEPERHAEHGQQHADEKQRAEAAQ